MASLTFDLAKSNYFMNYLKEITMRVHFFIFFADFADRSYKNSLFKKAHSGDLYEASLALVRLQKTYNLGTKSFSMGEIDGIKYRLAITTFFFYK